MSSKIILSLLAFLLFFMWHATSASAQDYIHLLNGKILKTNITSLIGKHVHYTPYGQETDEELLIDKSTINLIKMNNGAEFFFNRLPESNVEANVAPSSKKPPISAQKVQRRNSNLIYPMNFQVFGGIVMPSDGLDNFDLGYTGGIEYTNYYTNRLAFTCHLSGTYNEINLPEVKGSLLNGWLMAGAKIGTGLALNPVQLYLQGMAGGNYMAPSNDFDQIESSFNLAYSVGGGIIISDLINLGTRYHYSTQKLNTTLGREEKMNGSYLLFILGVQF
ncbi:MAG: hypothetical protein MI974_17350 [Chitinophagales bacterium]|nr:hypothetical protein [Chitinophagales bacterium]